MVVITTLWCRQRLKLTIAPEPLRELLDARTQLSNLMTYMDGKTGAEDLIAKIMQDPSLLKTLAAQPKPGGDAGSDAE